MFQVVSHPELLALLRAVVEAKFHPNPEDLDVPGSAILADVATRLARAVADEEIRMEGDVARARWQSWLHIGPDRLEWQSALAYAESMWKTIWQKWSIEQRRFAAKCLVSPFELDEVMLDAFICEVEARLDSNH